LKTKFEQLAIKNNSAKNLQLAQSAIKNDTNRDLPLNQILKTE